MDAERKKSAIEFRKELRKAFQDGTYSYDSDTRTITIDGYKYDIDKTFAETADGEPIPLHYTLNTVKKMIAEYLGEDTLNGELESDVNGFEETLYEIKSVNNDKTMKKIRLNESEFIALIENTVNEVLDSFNPEEKKEVARRIRQKHGGKSANADEIEKRADQEKSKHYSQDGNPAAVAAGSFADKITAPFTTSVKLGKFSGEK